MLNLNNTSNYLIETKYVGRKVTTPLVSVTKSNTVLNTSFVNEYLQNQPDRVFIQVVEYNNSKYLLVSSTEYQQFYSAVKANRGGYIIGCRGVIEVLGNKEGTVRYTVEQEKTSDPDILAYKLTPYVQDKVQTKVLPTNFRICA